MIPVTISDRSRVFEFADITLCFPVDTVTGRVGLEIFPTSLRGQLADRRVTLRGLPFIDSLPGDDAWPARKVDSLVQVKILGDPYSGRFCQGHTMREASSLESFRLSSQVVEENAEGKAILTTLASPAGHRMVHRLEWRTNESAFETSVTFWNESDAPVTLEMLSSFSLGGITPFHFADAPERLQAHRFRSGWSAEARLVTQSIEQLHLERSWNGEAASFSERFGQIGTMPARRWMPFVAVEDTEAGVVWGAQLAWAGSWQMEIYRKHDDLCLSGGLADREFGHWMKTLQPGESLSTPSAFISCVQGSLEALCERLTGLQQYAVENQPAVEQDLPIIFNEWCTTWGDPQHDKVVAIADRLRGTDVRYLVVDAGWYKAEGHDWGRGHGDWVPSTKLFPEGLEATAQAIRERGFIPGLWFEMETVGCLSVAFSNSMDRLLKLDGIPVTVGDRRFWDLNNPEVIKYLTEKVIYLLERCGFGYLKVDYNETLGIGCDDPDSPGEGLRKHVLAIYRFFKQIRDRLPHLVIENCSSGGHRLEPSMLAMTAMSSFSDAHELVEIPIIAANLHRLLLPRQSQIWAVLHPSDSDRRLEYGLAATFLGRMCLSGDIPALSPSQWQIAERAMHLYRKAAPIIKRGSSRIFGSVGESWRHPSGWQAVRRVGVGDRDALVVIHTFENAPEQIQVPLPGGNWRIVGSFPSRGEISGGSIHWHPPGPFSANVLLISQAEPE